MPKKRNLTALFLEWYHELLAQFGHRRWWPAETPFEVCVGAVLTQNTSWQNVVKAIGNLKAASLLDPRSLHDLPIEELARLIQPAGYFNVKARRLKNFLAHLVERHHGDLDSLFASPIGPLREELLSINGVGKETADSMILYAAGKPIFVVDAYTRRVLARHRLIDEKADYDAVQRLFHENLPRGVTLFNDFHAQFVAVGHHHCKRKAQCQGCPLDRFPHNA